MTIRLSIIKNELYGVKNIDIYDKEEINNINKLISNGYPVIIINKENLESTAKMLGYNVEDIYFLKYLK